MICHTGRVRYQFFEKNDYDCMNAIKKSGGIVGCPFDAVDDVKKISDYISSRRGGDGAVRDFIDWLITHQI